ncbi:hypothetical protein [Streptomyces sp. NPDC060194]|uniref:hypothetical protein n=1 Tax=Streptomyces sp. NPDC060194 TaxID=3347069 RepID=UPI00365DDE1D
MDLADSTPLDLTGNGRDRGAAEPDRLLATLVHLQLPAGSAGVRTPGRWEIAVPNGTYSVTVSVGDRSNTDSTHAIQVEDQNAVDGFVPTGTTRYQSRTVHPTVTDGRLTVSPVAWVLAGGNPTAGTDPFQATDYPVYPCPTATSTSPGCTTPGCTRRRTGRWSTAATPSAGR